VLLLLLVSPRDYSWPVVAGLCRRRGSQLPAGLEAGVVSAEPAGGPRAGRGALWLACRDRAARAIDASGAGRASWALCTAGPFSALALAHRSRLL
jgi:hypothetical protein